MEKDKDDKEIVKISLNIEKELLEEIDQLKGNDLTRAGLMRMILKEGIAELKNKGLQLNIWKR